MADGTPEGWTGSRAGSATRSHASSACASSIRAAAVCWPLRQPSGWRSLWNGSNGIPTSPPSWTSLVPTRARAARNSLGSAIRTAWERRREALRRASGLNASRCRIMSPFPARCHAMSADLEQLKKWIGERESDVDYVTIPTVHRLAATLDLDYPIPKAGDVLPVGWYSTFFPRIVRHAQVGPDGHPARGDFLPPVPLPRRMFAGKRTTFHGDLRVGDEIRRESAIKDVTPKTGRTGHMVFVTVTTD